MVISIILNWAKVIVQEETFSAEASHQHHCLNGSGGDVKVLSKSSNPKDPGSVLTKIVLCTRLMEGARGSASLASGGWARWG